MSIPGKKAVVRACLQPGASQAGIAMKAGVNANLVRKWIRLYGPGKGAKPHRIKMLPVTITNPPLPATRTLIPPMESARSAIEIVLPNATIRLHGVVDTSQLSQVLDCLRRS